MSRELITGPAGMALVRNAAANPGPGPCRHCRWPGPRATAPPAPGPGAPASLPAGDIWPLPEMRVTCRRLTCSHTSPQDGDRRPGNAGGQGPAPRGGREAEGSGLLSGGRARRRPAWLGRGWRFSGTLPGPPTAGGAAPPLWLLPKAHAALLRAAPFTRFFLKRLTAGSHSAERGRRKEHLTKGNRKPSFFRVVLRPDRPRRGWPTPSEARGTDRGPAPGEGTKASHSSTDTPRRPFSGRAPRRLRSAFAASVSPAPNSDARPRHGRPSSAECRRSDKSGAGHGHVWAPGPVPPPWAAGAAGDVHADARWAPRSGAQSQPCHLKAQEVSWTGRPHSGPRLRTDGISAALRRDASTLIPSPRTTGAPDRVSGSWGTRAWVVGKLDEDRRWGQEEA